MSQPSPAERLAALLPPDACREMAARIEELRRRDCGGRVATIEVQPGPGGVRRVVVEVHREYYFGAPGEKTG